MSETAKRPHVPVAQRRVQLVEAAMAVMIREGPWGLTTRSVAAEAGVSLGSLHYAFESKADLVGAVFAADIDGATAVITEAMEVGGSAEDMALAAVRAYASALRRAPTAELVVQELGLMGVREETLGEQAREAIVGFRAQIARFVEHLGGMSAAMPINVQAEVFFAQLVGLAQNWLITRDDDLLDACLEELALQVAMRATGRPHPVAATGR